METPREFPAGIQTDIRQLEKAMIPVCAVVCQDIIRKHKFTPYIKGIGGYSMSLSSITNGGNLWGLDIGTRFQWGTKGSITFSIGYEYQDYKVLRRAQSGPFRVECIVTISVIMHSASNWGDTSDGDLWERLRSIIHMGGIVAGFFCIGVPQLRPTA